MVNDGCKTDIWNNIQKTYDVLKDKLAPRYNEAGEKINEIYNYQYETDLYSAYDGSVNLARSIINAYLRAGYVKNDIHFFFFKYEYRDAYGGVQDKDLSLVGISKGLFESIHSYLLKVSPRLGIMFKIEHGRNFADIFKDSQHAYLYGTIMEFLIIHETGHVIQSEGKGEVESIVTENSAWSEKRPYREDCHIQELDTDQFAVRQITKRVVGTFDALLPEEQTSEMLECLVAVTLFGLYALFDILSDEMKPDIYLRKGDHPHQAVRIQAAIHVFESTLALYDPQKYKVDTDGVASKFSKLLARLTQSAQRFIDQILPVQGELNFYLDDLIKKNDRLGMDSNV